MKVRGYEKYQHFTLAPMYEKLREGKDVPQVLEYYTGLKSFENADAFASNDLHPHLTAHEAKDPENGLWRTLGFVEAMVGAPPTTLKNHEGDFIDDVQPLALAVPGTTAILMTLEKRERILPSQFLFDETAKRIKLLVEREQREANKKDWAVAKEETEAALLKTAPIRRTRIPVMMLNENVFVFTSSAKQAEDCTNLIRTALSSFPVAHHYNNEFALMQFFENVVRRNDKTREQFVPGCKGTFKDQEGAKFTIDEENLDEERGLDLLNNGFTIRDMLFGFRTQDLALKDGVVRMTYKGDVKSVSIGGEVDPGDDQFFTSELESMGGGSSFETRISEIWILIKFLEVFTTVMIKAGAAEAVDTSTEDEWSV